MKGRNFLLEVDGRLRKHGFLQNLLIEADNPRQAERLAISKLHHDTVLKTLTCNPDADPPAIEMDTFWALDVLDDIDDVDWQRRFYPEKRWWQFWK